MTGVEDDQVVAEGLGWTERLPVDRPVRDQARQVVGRVRAAILDDRQEELDELREEEAEKAAARTSAR